MSVVVRVLARGPTGPKRMRACPLEYLVGADGTGWHRTLGVLHARFQNVAQAELDRVETEHFGDLVHHHLGRRHGLLRALATGGASNDSG